MGHGGDMLGLEQEGVTSCGDVGADNREPVKRRALEVVRHETEELLLETCLPRMHLRLVFHAHAQGSGGILELLVDDETFDQDVTRLLWRQVRELVIEFGSARCRPWEEARMP